MVWEAVQARAETQAPNRAEAPEHWQIRKAGVLEGREALKEKQKMKLG